MTHPGETKPANHTVFSTGEPLGAPKKPENYTLHGDDEIRHLAGGAALGQLKDPTAPTPPRSIA